MPRGRVCVSLIWARDLLALCRKSWRSWELAKRAGFFVCVLIALQIYKKLKNHGGDFT